MATPDDNHFDTPECHNSIDHYISLVRKCIRSEGFVPVKVRTKVEFGGVMVPLLAWPHS